METLGMKERERKRTKCMTERNTTQKEENIYK